MKKRQLMKIIESCGKGCDFYKSNECFHPKYDIDKENQDRYIMPEDIKPKEIPKQCPLRNEELSYVYKLYFQF